MKGNLLAVKKLTVKVRATGTKILDDVSLSLPAGRVLGVVGGSGSGKTTLGLAVLQLISPALEQTGGEILFQGDNITAFDAARLRTLRGPGIGMVFQEPRSAFDPLYPVGQQIKEAQEAHARGNQGPVRTVKELLSLAGIPDPQRVAASYPYELSGGLLQRAMIAMAVSCEPKLLVADEPTSSLDVRTQAAVMAQFMILRKSLGLSLVLISHDLGLVRHFADDVVVLCQGRVVERCPVAKIGEAKHEYTRELMGAEGL